MFTVTESYEKREGAWGDFLAVAYKRVANFFSKSADHGLAPDRWEPTCANLNCAPSD